MIIDVPESHQTAPFDPSKKKKKKKVNFRDDVAEESNVTETAKEEEGKSNVLESGPLKLGELTDEDYIYQELLERIYGVVTVKCKTALKLPIPEVLRQGTKKTVLVNFLDFCKTMHREPEHFQSYLEAELASTSAIDGKNQLIFNGRFQVKHFESLLRKYANDYVLCNGCKSTDTVLARENRLMFLRCEECGSARSVAGISSGFQSVTRRVRNSR